SFSSANILINGDFKQWNGNIPKDWLYTQPFCFLNKGSFWKGNYFTIEGNAAGKQTIYQKLKVRPNTYYNFTCTYLFINRGGPRPSICVWGEDVDKTLLRKLGCDDTGDHFQRIVMGSIYSGKNDSMVVELGTGAYGINGAVSYGGVTLTERDTMPIKKSSKILIVLLFIIVLPASGFLFIAYRNNIAVRLLCAVLTYTLLIIAINAAIQAKRNVDNSEVIINFEYKVF
ncbi:MAG: hypothetical protein ABII23_00440, partial [bacterium]